MPTNGSMVVLNVELMSRKSHFRSCLKSSRMSPIISAAAAFAPDAALDPYRSAFSFAATARVNGAKILRFTEMKEILIDHGRAIGIRVEDPTSGIRYDIKADLIVNAAGPWSGKIAALAGVDIPLSLSPGIQVTINERFAHHLISCIDRPSDGDGIVPHRKSTIIGTSSWSSQDCDYLNIPPEHIDLMMKAGCRLTPVMVNYPIHSIFAATRPLIAAASTSERGLSRTFKRFDDAELDNIEGFITITGGKMLTGRAMAEKASNLVCQQLGVQAQCQTRSYPLLPYRRFFAG